MKTRLTIALLLSTLGARTDAAALRSQMIGLSATSVTFQAPFGGPDPGPSGVTLQNTGSGKLKWKGTSDQPWLSVTPSSGNLSAGATTDLAISAHVAGLSAGAHTGSIRISDPGASNSPVDIAVTLTVNNHPKIGLNPASLSFSAPSAGPNPPSKSLTIQNSGGGTLAWTAVCSPSWISSNLTSGSLTAGASDTLAISVSVSGLSAGPHSGTVTVTASGASNTPQTVDVSLTVSESPRIGVDPASLTFDAPKDGANPGAKTFTLTNQGGGTLGWSASVNAGWLGVSPTSGNLGPGNSQSLAVTANTSGLPEGTFNAAVKIDAGGASNTPVSVPVTLNVNATPKIGVNPLTSSFKIRTDSKTSPPSALSVTNTGAGTLSWTAASNAAWLTADPMGGSLDSLESEPVLLRVHGTGMAPGTYTASLTISDPQASNTSQLVTVELDVTESQLPTHSPAGQCGLCGLEAAALLLLLRTVRPKPGGRR